MVNNYKSKVLKYCFTATFLWLFTFFAQGQRCYTFENEQSKINAEFREAQFEDWLEQLKVRRTSLQSRTETGTLTVPVVVHIIHNGEPIGTGINLSNEQILSQIQVINEDFSRTNPDKSNTAAEFLSVASNPDIQFVLAKQSPEGVASSGIVRVKGSRSSYNWSEKTLMKSESYWPAEDYLNIWVADLVGPNGTNLLGYAEYPISNLSGLESATDNRLTDGVAIDYTVFGSKLIYPDGFYNSKYERGRTLTHELGHFFGLRHIWGDQGICGATDYCNDTPDQLNSTTGCPSTKASCSSNDMFQNFMDYTNDVCMNIFTADQTFRMRTVLENSPRRLSLTSSFALNDPIIFDFDAGIVSILSPKENACSIDLNPEIQLKNYGNNSISTVRVQLKVDGVLNQDKTFSTNLGFLQSAPFSFDPVPSQGSNSLLLEFEVLSVNGQADQRSLTNKASVNTSLQTILGTSFPNPYELTFENGLENWKINNPDNNITWNIQDVINGQNGNKSLSVNHYNYETIGENDWLLSPVIDFSAASAPFLSFDVSYANYPGSDGEGLLVGLITNCENNLQLIDTVYFQSGAQLATVPSTSSSFSPGSQNDWRSELFLDLSKYKNSGPVQLAFISTNAFGNNLYLDNISITTESSLDIAVTDIQQVGPITCKSDLKPVVIVTNRGTDLINSLEIEVTLDNRPTLFASVDNLNLASGESIELKGLTFSQLNDGAHQYTIKVIGVNETNDDNLSNNEISNSFIVDSEQGTLPFRENFNTSGSIEWKEYLDEGASIWSQSFENTNGFYGIENYNQSHTGEYSWLISPVLKFESFDKGRLFFDVAYSPGISKSEELELVKMDVCGSGNPEILFTWKGGNLNTVSYVQNYFPANDDWINKSALVSESSFPSKEGFRLALRVKNKGGNNLYIDNLAFFAGESPTPFIGEEYLSGPFPNPADGSFNLSFNLPEAEVTQIQIINNKGQLVLNQIENNVLNQTFNYPLDQYPSGVYHIIIKGKTFLYNKRLVVRH